MPDVVVIRNLRSGRGRLVRKWPELERSIREATQGSLEFWDTEGPGHATELARRACQIGVELVIAAGGDGTISQVANGLIGREVTLAVIPSGTGNDLCRTLGLGASIPDALKAIRHRRVGRMDVAHFRTDKQAGYFLNVAGMGFDATVADRINRGMRMLTGTSAYLVAVLAALGRFRAPDIRFTLDGQRLDMRVMLAALANAQCYGGGMKIAPFASVSDGLLDVVLVREIGKGAFLRAFPKVFNGTHLTHPAVTHSRATRIRLEPSEPAPFLVDGELVSCSWVDIEVQPSKLPIIVPENSNL
ncbi:MAG: diacylglycerol kinase family lipid kinase [Fimbriimonadaceae bacterium]|nr:diacylglycerol kinase family lipid kinase [Fimbriimonadaceae bacterium]